MEAAVKPLTDYQDALVATLKAANVQPPPVPKEQKPFKQ